MDLTFAFSNVGKLIREIGLITLNLTQIGYKKSLVLSTTLEENEIAGRMFYYPKSKSLLEGIYFFANFKLEKDVYKMTAILGFTERFTNNKVKLKESTIPIFSLDENILKQNDLEKVCNDVALDFKGYLDINLELIIKKFEVK